MDALVRVVRALLPEPHASLLAGILFGTTLSVSDVFHTQLVHAGVIHIAVLSGTNISILASIVLHPFVLLFGRKGACIATVVIICIYVYASGAQPPAVRAGLMASLTYIGLLYGRKTYASLTLLFSSVIMVLIDYTLLQSISFQLSVAATAGIVAFGEDPTSSRLESQSAFSQFVNACARDIRTTLAAQTTTLPIIFWHFREISLIAPIANVLISWLIAPLMIISGITVGIGMLQLNVARILIIPTYGLLHYMIAVISICAQIPFASIKLL